MNRQPDKREVGVATKTVALLSAQAKGLRAEIARLRKELAAVQEESAKAQRADIVEANGALVLSALHADTIAESVIGEIDELTRVSQRDALTGTPNRALMLDRLQNGITLARRRGTRLALLFVDLDRFKQINDTLGHSTGDEVLRLVARRMESVVRDSDTVSRHSGDEFLILLAEVSHPTDAALIATKMLLAIADAGPPLAQELSASIGIAIYPEDGIEASVLIGNADAAMYRSKKCGRGGFTFHGDPLPSEPTT